LSFIDRPFALDVLFKDGCDIRSEDNPRPSSLRLDHRSCPYRSFIRWLSLNESRQDEDVAALNLKQLIREVEQFAFAQSQGRIHVEQECPVIEAEVIVGRGSFGAACFALAARFA
jgi:hypothetical protein